MPNQNFNKRIKSIFWGCQVTLGLIICMRLYLGDFQSPLILSFAMLVLFVAFYVVDKGRFKLASNIFCAILVALATYYMWIYEGARDEVSYVLPAIIAFSLLTGSRVFALFLLIYSALMILSMGYLSQIGVRENSASTNSLPSSMLIVLLMAFSVYLFWILLKYLNDALTTVKHSLETQKAIIDNLGEALIIMNSKGVISQCSESAVKLFGYKKTEMKLQEIESLLPDFKQNQRDELEDELDVFAKASVTKERDDLTAINKTGEQIRVRASITLTYLENEKVFIALISDITPELEIREHLQRAREAADSANKAKSAFLANMSHEVRTPMNGMIGALQILSRQKLKQETQEIIETALLSSKSLMTIVNDILDFEKIEAGKLLLENEPIRIIDILRLTVSEIDNAIKVNENLVSLHVAENFVDGWLGDPVRVKQIFLNVVSNANKFTKNGKVNINLTSDETRGVVLKVSDTGIGMSADQLQRLFTRFEQADNSTTRKYGGTGLGMSITKVLVELMDGQINVTSEQEQGTEFEVILPLPKTNLDESRPQQDNSAVPDYSQFRILLAEDNVVNQTIFKKILEETKAQVTVANDGEEAVNIINEILPDLIFMDIQMPNMDGFEACREIKLLHPELPIIALTANVMVDDVKRYAKEGFDGHLGKPVDIEELYRAIKWHLM